jgi:hypothetical protein
MTEPGHLRLDGVDLSLAPGTDGMVFRPVIHSGSVRLTNDGFVQIARVLMGDRIALPQVTLEYVSARLIDGGAEVIVRAKRSPIDQTVTTRIALTPAGNGDLRATVTYMRVGIFAASWLLDFVLGGVERQPGLRKSGPKSIDLNLPVLLASRDVPVELRGGVEQVEATEQAFTITLRE